MHEFGRMLGGTEPDTSSPWTAPREATLLWMRFPGGIYNLSPEQIKAMRMPSQPPQGYVAWWADLNSCDSCKANMDAGEIPYGEVFPSGVATPPQHNHCQCILLISQHEESILPDYPTYADLREQYRQWLLSQGWINREQIPELLGER